MRSPKARRWPQCGVARAVAAPALLGLVPLQALAAAGQRAPNLPARVLRDVVFFAVLLIVVLIPVAIYGVVTRRQSRRADAAAIAAAAAEAEVTPPGQRRHRASGSQAGFGQAGTAVPRPSPSGSRIAAPPALIRRSSLGQELPETAQTRLASPGAELAGRPPGRGQADRETQPAPGSSGHGLPRRESGDSGARNAAAYPAAQADRMRDFFAPPARGRAGAASPAPVWGLAESGQVASQGSTGQGSFAQGSSGQVRTGQGNAEDTGTAAATSPLSGGARPRRTLWPSRTAARGDAAPQGAVPTPGGLFAPDRPASGYRSRLAQPRPADAADVSGEPPWEPAPRPDGELPWAAFPPPRAAGIFARPSVRDSGQAGSGSGGLTADSGPAGSGPAGSGPAGSDPAGSGPASTGPSAAAQAGTGSVWMTGSPSDARAAGSSDQPGGGAARSLWDTGPAGPNDSEAEPGGRRPAHTPAWTAEPVPHDPEDAAPQPRTVSSDTGSHPIYVWDPNPPADPESRR